MPIRKKVARSGWVVMLPLLASSCFTMGLWGFLPQEEFDPCTGQSETVYEYDDETRWSWELVGLRLLLTPLSLGLDLVTSPVQACMGSGCCSR